LICGNFAVLVVRLQDKTSPLLLWMEKELILFGTTVWPAVLSQMELGLELQLVLLTFVFGNENLYL
jgi:hypothetical protein